MNMGKQIYVIKTRLRSPTELNKQITGGSMYQRDLGDRRRHTIDGLNDHHLCKMKRMQSVQSRRA